MKRANGEGHVRRRGARWQVQVTDQHGKRLSATFETEEQAEAARAVMARRRARGEAIGTDRQRLDAYLAAWLTESIAGRVKARTAWQYECDLKSVVAELGHLSLARLSPQHIRHAYAVMREGGAAPATIRKRHSILKAALQQAVDDATIQRNPCASVKVGSATPLRTMRTLSKGELDRLCEATRDEPFGPLWAVLGTTGLRSGEARGLRWQDLELEANVLHVRSNAIKARGGGWELGDVKTAASRRTIHLSGRAVAAFYRQRERVAAWGTRPGWHDEGVVFPNQHGGILSDYVVSAALHQTLARLGLPDIVVHELRHTFATIMLYEFRVPVKVVSEMLGHTDVALTLRTYSHVLPGMHAEAALLWDEGMVDLERQEDAQ